ncbi:hypothetical protein S40293_10006 [Stachybotrys chartarum IBT 40293]|nr:hypothetical protein S40293_10006 [Stachybotrys chartarum IBT 40293]
MSSTLSQLAHEFAFLGDVKTARNLASLLLSEYATDWQQSQFRFLKLAFAAADEWPDQIALADRDEDSLNCIRPEVEPFAGPEYEGWSQTEKLDLLMRSFSSDQFSNISLTVPAAPRAGGLGDALSIAIDIAAEHGSSGEDLEHVENVQRLLSIIAENLLNSKIPTRSLVQHRNVWPILCAGALARTLRIDATKLKHFADTVLDTFIERLKKGRRPLKTASKPIGELLSIIEQNNKTKGVTFYEECDVDIPEVFHVLPGATDPQISDLETSLGVSLPDDYKEFLNYSNGFGDMFNGYFMNLALLGTDAVTWADTQYANILPIDLQGYPDGLFPLTPANGTTGADAYGEAMNHPQVPTEVKAITKKLVISRYGSWEEFMKLEWVVMKIFDTERTAFGSFRGYLEYMAWRSGWESTSKPLSCVEQDCALK